MPKSLYLNRRCDVHAPKPGTPGGYIERWPGSTRQWDLAKVSNAPSPAPGMETAARREALAILSPAPEAEYLLTHATNGDRVRLSASRSATDPLHWYLDDQYLGSSRPDGSLFLALTNGEHRLACMADSGESAFLRFSVLEH